MEFSDFAYSLNNNKSKIYTKTGDLGVTSLYNGDRLPKDAYYFECLGDLDELNCHLGLMKAFYKEIRNPKELYNPPGAGSLFYKHEKCLDTGKYYEWFILESFITTIQCNIMDISTFVATPKYTDIEKWLKVVSFSADNITNLEKLIDRIDSLLPSITNFVVPSGNRLISQTHVCRALTRRCERKLIKLIFNENTELNKDIQDLELNIKIYLNRLSDFLFIISRFISFTLNEQEDLYSKRKGIKQK